MGNGTGRRVQGAGWKRYISTASTPGAASWGAGCPLHFRICDRTEYRLAAVTHGALGPYEPSADINLFDDCVSGVTVFPIIASTAPGNPACASRSASFTPSRYDWHRRNKRGQNPDWPFRIRSV